MDMTWSPVAPSFICLPLYFYLLILFYLPSLFCVNEQVLLALWGPLGSLSSIHKRPAVWLAYLLPISSSPSFIIYSSTPGQIITASQRDPLMCVSLNPVQHCSKLPGKILCNQNSSWGKDLSLPVHAPCWRKFLYMYTNLGHSPGAQLLHQEPFPLINISDKLACVPPLVRIW